MENSGGFSSNLYGCESWTIKKVEHGRTVAFKMWCKRRLSRVPWTAQRSNQATLNIHWKDWSWSTNTLATWCKELTHWKKPWCWERLKAGGEGESIEDEMIGWHHQLSGHEFEQGPGVGDGQQSLVCCSPLGHKESDMTEWLNWLTYIIFIGSWDLDLDMIWKEGVILLILFWDLDPPIAFQGVLSNVG